LEDADCSEKRSASYIVLCRNKKAESKSTSSIGVMVVETLLFIS
jgi:hypothetical protein